MPGLAARKIVVEREAVFDPLRRMRIGDLVFLAAAFNLFRVCPL
jgi:hypothetical protein